MRSFGEAIGSALAIMAMAPPVAAQIGNDRAVAAQALFDEGIRLFGEGKVAEACPKLEESYRIDPGMATRFRLAECWEKAGRLATAFAIFTEVAEAAKAAQMEERERFARRRAAALEPRLARLTIVVPPAIRGLAGLDIRRDGVPLDARLWDEPVPVDPGEHVVTAAATGKVPWEARRTVDGERVSIRVAIPLLAAPHAPARGPEKRRSQIPTIVLSVLAAAGAGAGAGLLVAAGGARSDAEERGAALRARHRSCLPEAANYAGSLLCSPIASDAKAMDTFHDVATAAFAVSGAAVVGALTYALWPSPRPSRAGLAVEVAAPPGGAGGSVRFSGSF